MHWRGAPPGKRSLGRRSVAERIIYIHADFALIGASGMDLKGCSTTEVSEAEMKRAILDRCKTKILLADISKWEQPSTIQFANWSDLMPGLRIRKSLPRKAKLSVL